MRYLTLISCCLLIPAACKKKPAPEPPPAATPQLKVEIQPVFGTEVLELDSTYTTQDGWDVQFNDIKFYLTDWASGTTELADVARFDYRTNGTTAFQVNGTAADFSSLTGNIGVSPSINHADPSAFPSTSPLNIMNADGMHWAWNTGYIFIIIEGRADTIPDGMPLFDHFLSYHIGSDEYLGTVNFPAVTWTATTPTLSTAHFRLDLKTMIDHPVNPVDIRSENLTHSSGSQATLTQKILSNFLDAFTTP
jgi:hypothetical protein